MVAMQLLVWIESTDERCISKFGRGCHIFLTVVVCELCVMSLSKVSVIGPGYVELYSMRVGLRVREQSKRYLTHRIIHCFDVQHLETMNVDMQQRSRRSV